MYGGEVKADGAGVVSGKGIVFGSPDQPDSSYFKDYFTDESFINKRDSFEVPLYFDHGMGTYQDQIGDAVMTKGPDGWQVVAQLDLEDASGKQIYDMVKEGDYGFSTGALSHLVQRIESKNDTNWLKRWVVGEISLTKRPAEPRAVVENIKCIGDDGSVCYKDAFAAEEPEVPEVPTKSSPDSTDEEITLKTLNAKLEELLDEVMTMNTPTVVVKQEAPKELVEQIKSLLEEKNSVADVDELESLKSDLKAKDEELAELTNNLDSREDELTKAKTKIAQLEILAGAKDYLDKLEGK